MRKITRAALSSALVLFGGCGVGARASMDLEGMVTPLTLEPPPIYALLGYRGELGLSSEQVTMLDSIAVAVQAQNRPLILELQATHSGRSRQPGVFRVSPEGEPILAEIRANQRRASEGVAEVLTAEQRESVCWVFERWPERGRVLQQRPPPMAGRDTAALRRAQPRSGWHWCSQGEPGEAEPEVAWVRGNGETPLAVPVW